MTRAIKLNNLTKQFGKKSAVDKVSLTVESGEIFGFLGPNGAGKTTVIRMMMGLISPTNGHITIFGKDSLHNATELHHTIGYLAGDMAMYDKLTGKQYLDFFSNLYGERNTTEFNLLLQKLNADLRPKIKHLSRGNKQKIGLISALMHQPKLLILDEPTSGLDPLMQEVFYELLNEHKKRGGTTFMSSHNLAEIQRVCDRVAFIRNGSLTEVSTVKALRTAAAQEFVITLGAKPNPAHFENISTVRNISFNEKEVRCTVSGHVNELLRVLTKYDVVSIASRELELEEVFLQMYGGNT